MMFRRDQFEKKARRMRRLVNAFMSLMVMLPLAGIAALLLGFAEPGDGEGEGSMTKADACLILGGAALGFLLFWKLLLMALDQLSHRLTSLRRR
ncbi:hypothetical protein [Sulfuriroseicoccus oceanibius]|uniref:Transmembrane protein n=1 Tax=Sulfuriroseicoccus oceanibius TaxID=2707525 RepID=A0A7T7JBB6_9BACT|nr:hypothetical protein [Sulfuriroseicoccus oceanibius]QQL44097.1 hypothetical protein G3M56_009340 [Sulfuriroseicoccus oceanibius]